MLVEYLCLFNWFTYKIFLNNTKLTIVLLIFEISVSNKNQVFKGKKYHTYVLLMF